MHGQCHGGTTTITMTGRIDMLASQCDIVEDANAIAMTTVTITDEP